MSTCTDWICALPAPASRSRVRSSGSRVRSSTGANSSRALRWSIRLSRERLIDGCRRIAALRQLGRDTARVEWWAWDPALCSGSDIGRVVSWRSPAGDRQQADGGIIAHRRERSQRHAEAAHHSPLSSCSRSIVPTGQTTAFSSGKIPTSYVRRLVLPLTCSSGSAKCSLARCCAAKLM
jgi:hypothetical protein